MPKFATACARSAATCVPHFLGWSATPDTLLLATHGPSFEPPSDVSVRRNEERRDRVADQPLLYRGQDQRMPMRGLQPMRTATLPAAKREQVHGQTVILVGDLALS